MKYFHSWLKALLSIFFVYRPFMPSAGQFTYYLILWKLTQSSFLSNNRVISGELRLWKRVRKWLNLEVWHYSSKLLIWIGVCNATKFFPYLLKEDESVFHIISQTCWNVVLHRWSILNPFGGRRMQMKNKIRSRTARPHPRQQWRSSLSWRNQSCWLLGVNPRWITEYLQMLLPQAHLN